MRKNFKSSNVVSCKRLQKNGILQSRTRKIQITQTIDDYKFFLGTLDGNLLHKFRRKMSLNIFFKFIFKVIFVRLKIILWKSHQKKKKGNSPREVIKVFKENFKVLWRSYLENCQPSLENFCDFSGKTYVFSESLQCPTRKWFQSYLGRFQMPLGKTTFFSLDNV